jgi:hypothetical protein
VENREILILKKDKSLTQIEKFFKVFSKTDYSWIIKADKEGNIFSLESTNTSIIDYAKKLGLK